MSWMEYFRKNKRGEVTGTPDSIVHSFNQRVILIKHNINNLLGQGCVLQFSVSVAFPSPCSRQVAPPWRTPVHTLVLPRCPPPQVLSQDSQLDHSL